MTKSELDVKYTCTRLHLQRIAAVEIAAEETQHCMFTCKAVCIKGCDSAAQRSSDHQNLMSPVKQDVHYMMPSMGKM